MVEYFKDRVSIVSMKGGRARNEDSAGHIVTDRGELIVVCDGVGGAECGERASKLAVNNIIDEYKNGDLKLSIKETLIKSIQRANSAVKEEQVLNDECYQMATTVVVAHLAEGKLTMAHAGDSRLYHYKNGRLIFVTKDHSEVQRLLDKKKIKRSEVFGHPRSNEIYNCLGLSEYADITIGERTYKKEDVILLTTDGIHDVLNEGDLVSIIKGATTIKGLVSQMSALADTQGKKIKNNKHDNLTVAVFSSTGVIHRTYKRITKIVAMACFLGLLTFISYAYFSGYLEPNKAHEPIEAIKDKAIDIEEVTRTIENDPQGYFTNQEDFEQSGILEKLDSIYEERLILITGEAVEMDSSLILGQLVVDTTIENREIIILKLNENRNEKDK